MDLHVHSGTLLASAPSLADPNFMHTVVLMIQHSDEGAYGLVVNKKSAFAIGELLPDHPLLGGSTFPVHWGGPVGGDTLQILHRAPEILPGGMELGEGLFLGAELDAVGRFVVAEPDAAARQLRFLLGYSGWGERQLDQELVTESWLPAATKGDLVFEAEQESTWRRVVQSVGGEARGFEDLPPDVSWN